MTAAALAIVLVAAFTHATWNYAAKRAGGGLPFVFVSNLIGLACYVPAVAFYAWWRPPHFPPGTLWIIAGSGLIKTTYSLLLQRGYRTGDFSLIYPLARGTGPLLSTVAAIACFGERPSALALAGGAAIIVGVFYLTGGPAAVTGTRPAGRTAAGYGLAAGVCIAAYTVWDQHAVSREHLPPLLYDCGTSLVMFVLLLPFAWRRRDAVAAEWRTHRREAAAVGILGPTGYVLILTAMTFTPVSYIAPAREISIVIGAFFGLRLLREPDAPRRLAVAAVMALGIVALALG